MSARGRPRLPAGVRLWVEDRFLLYMIALFWVVFLSLEVVDTLRTTFPEGYPTGVHLIVARGTLSVWVWVIAAVGATLVARRFPLEGAGVWRMVAAHLVVAVTVVAMTEVSRFSGCHLYARAVCQPRPFLDKLGLYTSNLLYFYPVLVMAYGLLYAHRHRAHEIAGSRLEARLAEARLAALKAQLHPHFLFNTLNSVLALMHRDVPAAQGMLERLERLLALTLERSGVQEVPLSEELRFLALYTGIEGVRFSDRLRLEVAVEAGVREALVPHLVLQPLVENAIRHGIAARPGPGRLEVRARGEGGSLRLTVSDDGPAGEAPPGSGNGVGLANTRARLEQLYGAAQRFETGPLPGGGFAVTLVIPLRFAPAPEPA